MIIIAITGTLGAGKGTVVEYLQTKGFTHYSVREYLGKETARRGMSQDRDALRAVANDLRKTHFPGYIIGELLRGAQKVGGKAIIESIRAVGEVELLRREAPGCLLLAVDADINTRYRRIQGRASATDRISFEKFMIDEERELASGEPWDMNLKGCMAAADFRLENSGSVHQLHAQIDAVLRAISG